MEIEYNEYEALLASNTTAANNAAYDGDFNEEDALMINDSIYDFETDQVNTRNAPKELRQATMAKLENVLRKIDSNMSEKLLINSFYTEGGKLNTDLIKLVKCAPDLTGFCFGHLNREIQESNNCAPLFSPVDQLDHTKFEIEFPNNKPLAFRKGEKSFVTFVFPDTKTNNSIGDQENFHDMIQVDLYDDQEMAVEYDLKEKIASMKRYIRICFLPQSSGTYKLSIKFKNTNIPNSPHSFTVLPEQAQSSSSRTNLRSNSSSDQNYSKNSSIKSEPIETDQPVVQPKPHQKTNADKLGSNLSENHNPTRPMGRGSILKLNDRLRKMNNDQNQAPATTTAQISAFISQKRKSYNDNENAGNNVNGMSHVMDADESPVRDLSNKLQRVVNMDDSVQRVHSRNNGVEKSLTTTHNSIISNHIRKHLTSTVNGVTRLIEDKPIPSLKAKFQRKFMNCFYPIGVRVCKLRNWLIVCDSGNNAVKVFERTSGELLNEIKAEIGGPFTLVRPSAVLINHHNNAEIYVKDDKEIMVFDLEQDCKFIRKFGQGTLRKPYGLAYDSQSNIVLVDADMRNPLIYTFDKETGRVLNSKPYHPVLAKYAKSDKLHEMFGKNKTLGEELASFEKSKVRFICCNQDKVYASDLGRSIIFKTDLNGETNMAFGKFGKKRGELCEPSGIHVDNDGKAILVGDSKNDRIQVI